MAAQHGRSLILGGVLGACGVFALADAACGGPQGSPDSGDAGTEAAGPPVVYDVVVVGAGSGGVSAAVEAARHGARVLLVESTGWVGGQKLLVAFAEVANTAFTETGIVGEFEAKASAQYQQAGKPLAAQSLSVEPHVARDVLTQMLADAKVDVLLHTGVTAALVSGGVVGGVVLSNGETALAKVVIDATELGDVIPLTGAEYRVANQISSGPIDPNACVQDMTYVATIRRYPQGVAPQLFVTSPPPGFDAALTGPAFLPGTGYTYTIHQGFQGMVTPTGTEDAGYPWDFYRANRYRAMPDSTSAQDIDFSVWSAITKTDANFANDYPVYTVANDPDGGQSGRFSGKLSVSYVEDLATRTRVDCAAKLLTLQFLYYVQHDLAAQGGDHWSVADDEFGQSADFSPATCPEIPTELKPIEQLLPPVAYARESRRIVPLRTLTVSDTQNQGGGDAKPVHTAVSRATSAPDLHWCRDDTDLEADLGDTYALRATAAARYQVPLESLVPVQIDGLLAAEKNIGVSRFQQGSVRLQGTTFMTGQAVGALAALAVQHAVAPRKVDSFELQRLLVGDGDGLSVEDFGDVSTTDARWGAIQLVDVRGLMAPMSATSFAPDAVMTREQGAMPLAVLMQYDISNPPVQSEFTDVLTSDFYYRYIEAIYHNNVTGGCSTNPLKFCPLNPLLREQFAALLVTALKLDTNNIPTQPYFTDFTDSTNPFWKFVQAGAKAGVVLGCGGGNFCPTASMLRGDATPWLVAAMILVGAPP